MLILPRMTAELQGRTLAEIMDAAQTVMGEAGSVIVGGHTLMGSELTVGFALTGICEADPIPGRRPGDVLVLTKPRSVPWRAPSTRRALATSVSRPPCLRPADG